MALALGGSTVSELQQRMSLSEVRLWQAYIKKFGPLTVERMYDRPAALIGSILSKAYGGKATMKDLMFRKQDDENEVASIDDVVSAFGQVNRGR